MFNAFDVDDSGAIDEVCECSVVGAMKLFVFSYCVVLQNEFRTMLITMAADDSLFPGTFKKLLEAADAYAAN